MAKAINPRPGVVVALTDRYGDLACYDPSAYRRADYQRCEKIRKAREAKRRQEHEEDRIVCSGRRNGAAGA